MLVNRENFKYMQMQEYLLHIRNYNETLSKKTQRHIKYNKQNTPVSLRSTSYKCTA